jgi:hypothetical protein
MTWKRAWMLLTKCSTTLAGMASNTPLALSGNSSRRAGLSGSDGYLGLGTAEEGVSKEADATSKKKRLTAVKGCVRVGTNGRSGTGRGVTARECTVSGTSEGPCSAGQGVRRWRGDWGGVLGGSADGRWRSWATNVGDGIEMHGAVGGGALVET